MIFGLLVSASLAAAAGAEPSQSAPAIHRSAGEAKEQCEAAKRSLYKARELNKAARSLGAQAEPEDVAGREITVQAGVISHAAAKKVELTLKRVCGRAQALAGLSARLEGAVFAAAYMRGAVQIKTAGGWRPLTDGTVIRPGETIRTGKDGYVELVNEQGAQLRLDKESSFAFTTDEMELSKGAFYYLKKEAKEFSEEAGKNLKAGVSGTRRHRLISGNNAVSIQGTRFVAAAHGRDELSIAVLEGEVAHSDVETGVQTSITPGYRVVLRAGKVASGPVPIDPRKPLAEWGAR